MKREQKRSLDAEKNEEKKKSFFKYNNLQNLQLQSSSKKNKSEIEYTAFIEGYSTPQSFNELKPISDVFSEKQLSRVSLFESVKKSKGELYFKTIYQRSKYLEVNAFQDISLWVNEKKYFVFIISGQFNLYKQTDYSLINNSEDQQKVVRQSMKQKSNQANYNKCYIRSYVAHQHFGYQEYPLYWKQKLIFEASTFTQILLFPLDTLYKVFSNVINLSSIQITAEFLKKLPAFKEVQMEKLLRLSTFSQRIRTYPNTVIVEKGQKIDNIILLYDGRISVFNNAGEYNEQRSGFLIGKKEADSKVAVYQQQVRSLIQCDFIVIPLIQFSKVSQIKQKLRDSYLQQNQRNIKSRKKVYSNLSLYQIEKKQSMKTNSKLDEYHQKKNSSVGTLQPNKPKSFFVQNSSQISKIIENRPRTASQGLIAKRSGSKSVVYNENGRHFFFNRMETPSKQKRSISTILGPSQGQKSLQKQRINSSQIQGLQNVTIGEIYWAKFMNRKNQLQNKQIAKIIKSRLPESILNENKEFTVVQPLIQKKSTYIKNLKRKIKNSHKINNIRSVQEQIQRKRMEFRVESQQNRICLESFMIDDQDLS